MNADLDQQGVPDPAQAQALGFNPEALARLGVRVQRDIDARKYDGARILVARRGVPVLDLTLGYADRETGRKLEHDAVFSIMSISKVMTAVALLRCVERGEVSLLSRVAQFIPEFAARGKERVTVGQLLTHTAGLGMQPAPLPLDQLGQLEKCVAAICHLPLESTPGDIVSYSASTGFTILGEIVRRLDARNRPFRKILEEDIFLPLGMKDTVFGRREDLEARRVPVVIRDADSPEMNPAFVTGRDRSIVESSEYPSGGGSFSSAEDLMRFAEMLRLGGALDGVRILSPATVELMTRNQTGLKPNSMMNSSRALHGMAPFPAFLGLGLFLRGEGIFPSHIPPLASGATFGGWGLGSTAFWTDPHREVTFVALTAGLMERIRNLLRFGELGDMVLASVEEP